MPPRPHRVQQNADNTHRVNESIRISPVRLIDQEGTMHGVVETDDAREMARAAGLDLVEVSANERPPVCKIMDYGKYKYDQKKKAGHNKQHQVQIKEVRLRPKIGDHDIEFKMKQAIRFLKEKDKVKLNVFFRGRENAHHDRGREMLEGIIKDLEEIAKVEKTPGMEGGRNMTAVLAPK